MNRGVLVDTGNRQKDRQSNSIAMDQQPSFH